MWRGTDTQTDTQTAVTNIHFASSTTHAKCNNNCVKTKTSAGLTTMTWGSAENHRTVPFRLSNNRTEPNRP